MKKMAYVFWDRKEAFPSDYTLILPSISVGNVGQLTVDLLLNNLSTERIAQIHHPCFVPVICPDPYDENNSKLTISCQLYECSEKKLVIIQNRSPVISGKSSEYQKFLVDFIQKYKIKKTVLLCSTFSEYFTFEDLQGIPLHFLCTSKMDEDALNTLLCKPFSLPKNVNQENVITIPGGGIAKVFLEECKQKQITLVVFIRVCSEGDNFPDAFQMVSKMNEWLQLKDGNQWKVPISWNSPFGNTVPITLF